MKSVTAHAIMRLLQSSCRNPYGSVLLEGRNLLDLTEEMQKLRGNEIGMIFQDL